jgi:predicted phosphodiesterase
MFDLISDLHVNKWTNFPYKYGIHKKNNILVIAGDLSDTIEETVNELKKACLVYEHVLYVDGNHDSNDFLVKENFHIIVPEIISNLMKDHINFHHLQLKPFLHNDVLFVGACAWWDFQMFYSNDTYEYFKNNFLSYDGSIWTENQKNDIINHIKIAADDQFNKIKNDVKMGMESDDVKKIVVVTHTIPGIKTFVKHSTYNSKSNNYFGNSKMKELFDYSKVKMFVFGHDHNQTITSYNDKVCINHARGRPQDHNRKDYRCAYVYLN